MPEDVFFFALVHVIFKVMLQEMCALLMWYIQGLQDQEARLASLPFYEQMGFHQ